MTSRGPKSTCTNCRGNKVGVPVIKWVVPKGPNKKPRPYITLVTVQEKPVEPGGSEGVS